MGAYEINNASMIQILRASDQSKKRGGSVIGHKCIGRDRRKGHDRLFADYFAANSIYSPAIFQRRSRMRRLLYLRILNAIEAHDPYFVKKKDVVHILRLSPLQKMTSAIRILSYGVAADTIDDYVLLAIGEVRGFRSGKIVQQHGKIISSSQGAKKQHFARMQESTRKDIKRAFRVLQSRFAIVGGPVHFWDPKMLDNIMKSYVILHNMIVEDERDEHIDFNYEISSTNSPVLVSCSSNNEFQSFMSCHLGIRDKNTYYALRNDLIEHMWHLHGEN
ncbi:uncharacterized protein LOC114271962 [Camellia sinensis]|uniref:uncharacterized protein LOC114271962 n=1 Tax=Camellia sinensis TaxID=4442 RepID=UPI0010366887|nr:uncharacterized protein LOC114271962 [Camellia sinensis]